MRILELPVRAFLDHLRRHPFPEIMDEQCLSDLQSVEKQYGDTVSHGAGLEVRLGAPERYTDYIMNIDTADIPGVPSLWHEIDYREFRKANRKGDRIAPCLFANVEADLPGGYARLRDETLPALAGRIPADRLRPALDRVTALLPAGASIRQIGAMSARGGPDLLRLVVFFHSWTEVCAFLAAAGWQGDGNALCKALTPWQFAEWITVDMDLGADGILPKIGFEVHMPWRHPVLVDRLIARMEAEGLCLPSKAEALRRWIRIRPDGDPFIQTTIAYFKLNYRDGRVTEAKAYLEQSPCPRHFFFEAYDRPIRLDLELKNGNDILDSAEARARLEEYRRERGLQVRFYGAADYPETGMVAETCRELGLEAEFILPAEDFRNAEDRLRSAMERGESRIRLLIDLNPEEDVWDRSVLRGRRVRWFMHRENASLLADVAREAERYGAEELIIAPVRPGDRRKAPSREQIGKAAEFLRNKTEERKAAQGKGMPLSVESCFSPLRAWIGGPDPKRNPNRGVGSGCEAGRSFLAVRADGLVTPCLWMRGSERAGTLAGCWTETAWLDSLRKRKSGGTECGQCSYAERCLPCPGRGCCQ